MKLSVSNLNSHYGPAHILFDIGLEVGEGEVVALLGRNGAGKSTTFRSIVGLVAQRSGRIMFEGKDVSVRPTHEIVREGLGYVPEERRIFTDLTVEENLMASNRPTSVAVHVNTGAVDLSTPNWTAPGSRAARHDRGLPADAGRGARGLRLHGSLRPRTRRLPHGRAGAVPAR